MIDHLAHLRADVDAVLDVLHRADLTEPVAACPGWTLRGLVEHLGSVHRWAEQIVATGDRGREEEHDVPDLAQWFAEGADRLITTLGAADPARECWSFTTDRTAGFWLRRQALETVVHRWDAERATGEPGRIAAQLAADGVSEVVDLMTPRQVKLGRIPPLAATLQLHATDTRGEWVLGDGEPTARAEGSAETLLLLLWHRVDPGDPRVRTTGDAARVLQLALAP
ncbi:MAG: maleylpyruvate isomerase family mycothiol-dependent enzyme [Frankiaceae bacterium]|nr:maleylpyruvate isomerase family mycothiol-dependent enzyme [Frankiaceae bacterium]